MAEKLITVFGASGFIGRYVVKRLATQGYLVRAAVREPASALFLKTMGDVGQVTPLQANIRDEASVSAAIEGAHGVVNLIGILFESGKQKFDEVHRKGAENIAKASTNAGVQKLVHVSALGASEDSQSAYARSKAAGENAVRAAFGSAVVFRPSVVFGPQDDFFNRFAEMVCVAPALPIFGCPLPSIRNGTLDCYGDGGTKFQPIYAGDLADAIVQVIDSNNVLDRTYELGGPQVYSFKEILDLILLETGRRRLLVPLPFWIASIVAFFTELLPVPPLTRDQVILLRSDNVVNEGSFSLADLGIDATSVESIVPSYLDQYCKGGRFSRFSNA
ncbi:MAG: complex I NDUFA9 subunit family protein [Rhodospirillaceae bacterium]|nr:complex I NDUFA9 subunit family protein [Rhodospirillaceae bacterium]